MSELKDRWFWAYPTESVDCDGITGSAHEVYSKSDVDAAIAELKHKLEEQESQTKSALKAVSHWHDNYCELQKVVDRMQTKLECKEDKTRILNRALWLARAERALAERKRYCAMSAFKDIENDALRIKWCIIQRKCRDKAEEYK